MAKRPARNNRRDPDRTREAILVAAQDEFAAKGLAGGRVNVIARRAGANKRMIYHYFGSKDGLYLAALERVYEGLRGQERTMHLDRCGDDLSSGLVERRFDQHRSMPMQTPARAICRTKISHSC